MPGCSRSTRLLRLAIVGLLALPSITSRANAQILLLPDSVFRAGQRQYQAALLGPQRRTGVMAVAEQNLPSDGSGCLALWNSSCELQESTIVEAQANRPYGTGYTVPAQIISNALELSTGFRPPTYGSCIAVPGLVIGNCVTGARAATQWGSNKVAASALVNFEEQTPDDTAYVNNAAMAESEFIMEVTSTFTGRVTLNVEIERHPGLFGITNPGGGEFTFSFFEHQGSEVDRDSWTFYGNNIVEEGSNDEFWGWKSVNGDFRDIDLVGLTSLRYELDVVSGQRYSLAMGMFASAFDGQTSNFWGTARLDRFIVPDNVDPASAFVFSDGEYLVQRAFDNPPGTAVPEPSTALLLLMGFVGLHAAAHRARRIPR